MRFLSDKTVQRLRESSSEPDLSGTRYRLIERVARGGMGVVYTAQDEMLERRVALKILDAPGPGGELAGRLHREARVLARLEHPGIVPVHDVGTLADGRVFYTMKFVEGQRLDKHIQSVPSLPDRLRLFLRICDTVAFAHARGVLHRDLKPTNVMVGAFGEVLLMDWGLAKILRESATVAIGQDPDPTVLQLPNVADAKSAEAARADFTSSPSQNGGATTSSSPVTGHGTVLGTPGYMSPEQARGDVVHLDQRSDLYSLGAILKFLCSENPANTVSSRPWQISKSLLAISAKAMSPNAQERYATAEELAIDVSRYLDGLPVSARKESFPEQLVRFYHRYSIAILLLAAYLVMRVLLLLFFRR